MSRGATTPVPPPDALTAQSSDHKLTGQRSTRTNNNADPDPPSACQHALSIILCPFRAIANFIFFNSFTPTDSFMQKLRKVIAGCMAVAALGYIVNVLDFVDAISLPTATHDQIIFAYLELFVHDFMPVAAMIIAFIYCRYTQTAPDWIMGVPALCLLVSQLFYSLGTATIDLAVFALSVYSVISMTGVGRGWSVVGFIIAFLLVCVNGLNISRTVTWILPGARAPYTPQALSNYIFDQGILFVMMSFFLHVVVKEFDGMIEKAEGAVAVSKDLASKLRKYDTHGAREVLLRCVSASSELSQHPHHRRKNMIILDAELLEAFTGIVENLEQYRPHLPNYLLDDGSADPEAHGPVGEHASLGSPGRSDADTTHHHSTPNGLGSGKHNSSSNHINSPHSSNQQQHHHQSRLFVTRSQDDLRSDRVSIVAISDDGTSTSQHRSTSNLPYNEIDIGGGPKLDLATQTITGKVSATIVEVAMSLAAADRKTALDAIVSVMSDVAATTQASLHCFIGDRLVATWNATKRLAKPESRACCFSIRLRDVLARMPNISSASMTVTGEAESCFAGDHRLRMFACTSPKLWERARVGLTRIRHLPVAAIDVMTREHASVDVSSRGLALLLLPSSSFRASTATATSVMTPTCLYQLLEERPQEERNQEWMYVLGQHDDHEDTTVTQALHAYASGRPEEGISLLEQYVPAGGDPDPVVQDMLQDMMVASKRKTS